MKMVNASGAIERVAATERTLHGIFDKLDDPLGEVLQATGYIGGRLFGGTPENIQKQQAQSDGKSHRIQMDRPETHLLGLLDAMGNAPAAIRVLTKGQVLQVVADIFS